MKKKILALVLALLAAFSMTACSTARSIMDQFNPQGAASGGAQTPTFPWGQASNPQNDQPTTDTPPSQDPWSQMFNPPDTPSSDTQNSKDSWGQPQDAAPASDGMYEYQGVSIALPSDFSLDDSGSVVVAYVPEYPEKTDNVAFTYSGPDSADNYTQETFESIYASMFDEMESLSFQKGQIDGYDAIMYIYALVSNDVAMTQAQVFLFLTDKCVCITFTSVSGDYDAEFDKMIDSIKVV